MTDVELMMDLFQGSDISHGRTDQTQKISPKGKQEARSWLEKRPAAKDDWTRHLEGKAGLGISPINSENTVRFGAIDVDIYNLSNEALNQKIQEAKLPLVLCRSKSGGPHIFLFLSEWIPAALMIEKLSAIAAFLGFGASEIFPKQAVLAKGENSQDYGSWINMPYFGGTQFLRYAIDATGKALVTIPAFHAYVMERRYSTEQLKNLRIPEPPPLLPDGPPCLNYLYAETPSDFRNVILANTAVYVKKAFGNAWKAKLDEYNARFSPPLGSEEVEAIKKSYDKKEYKYQCHHQPLCGRCDASTCKARKFGIGGANEVAPGTRSLTKLLTDPVIWFLDIEQPDRPVARISLSSEQLQNPTLFQRRCMETISRMPPVVPRKEWQEIVDRLMRHANEIAVPPEMTPEGQFEEALWDFLHNRASVETWEDLLRGLPFRDASYFHFRMKDLLLYLQQKRFTGMKPHEMAAYLKQKLHAESKFRKISGRGVNYLTVPIPKTEEGEQPLAPATFTSDY